MELGSHDECKKCGYTQFVYGVKPILQYKDGYWRIVCPKCGKGTRWCKTRDKAIISFKK